MRRLSRPLLFTSLLFTAIYKASAHSCLTFFAFLFHGDGVDPCLCWPREVHLPFGLRGKAGGGKPFNIIVIQIYALTSNAEEAEIERFYEDLQDLLELTPPSKRCPFHYRGLECKSRKS